MTTERHAVYANCVEGITFRVGLPTNWERAIARWYRLDDARFMGGRVLRVRHARRWSTVRTSKDRTVDRHGVGIGEERHARAIPVRYFACRVKPNTGKRRPLDLRIAPASARI